MTIKRPFAVLAAKFSLWGPIIAIFMNLAARISLVSHAGIVVVAFVSAVVYLAAFILGIVALFAIRKHGAEGIFVPALLGVIISGLIILLALFAIPAYVNRRQGAMCPPATFSSSQHASALSGDYVKILG